MASRDIERQLKEDEEKFKKISRLLLLGKFDFFFSLRRQRHERFRFRHIDTFKTFLFCLWIKIILTCLFTTNMSKYSTL